MFTLTIETDNAAFGEPDLCAHEIARILTKAAKDVQRVLDAPPTTMILRDVNGNRVGRWSFSD